MVKLNITRITINQNAMIKIANLATSPAFLERLKSDAEMINKKATPYIPKSVRRTKRGKHLRDAYVVKKPSKYRMKINNETYPASKINIGPPKKYYPYAAIIAAGHKKKVPFKTVTVNLPHLKILKQTEDILRNDFELMCLKEIGKINDK